MSTAEWNARVYHEVSNPHVVWGQTFVSNLDLRGDEVVIDAGCGTGRVTALLLERLPRGRVIAVDRSDNMLDQARDNLESTFPGQVSYVQSDFLELTPDRTGEPADVVFSTATFHWIRDHDKLFSNIFALLRPGGRLDAKCGGGPNLAGLVERADSLISSPPWAEHFSTYDQPKFYAVDVQTGTRLEKIGFTDVDTTLVEAPTVLPDRDTYVTFLTNVIYRQHLAALPTEDLKASFISKLADQAATDDPPFELDYWRLNIHARRTR